MKGLRAAMCALLLVVGAVSWLTTAGTDPRLGLLITGSAGEYLFSFPQGEQFMFVRFGGTNASFSILTGTTLYDDICAVFAGGLFAGYQTTGVGLLDREIAFADPGSFGNLFVAGETLARFSFASETGVVNQRFEITEELLEESFAYVQFVVGEFDGELWLEVLNGELVEPLVVSPRLRLASYSVPAGGGGEVGDAPGTVTMTITNDGPGSFTGPVQCGIGLSYGTNWIPEWCTLFCDTCLANVTLGPGESGTYEVAIPVIPISAVDALRKRELLWTGYMDPDPGQDYIGVHLCIGNGHWCLFVPFQEVAKTTAMRKVALGGGQEAPGAQP